MLRRGSDMNEIFVISFTLFIVYAPVSIIIKNIANKVVNDKTEIWTLENNRIMIRRLKKQSKKLYYAILLEHCIFFQFVLVSLCRIIF